MNVIHQQVRLNVIHHRVRVNVIHQQADSEDKWWGRGKPSREGADPHVVRADLGQRDHRESWDEEMTRARFRSLKRRVVGVAIT